MRQRITVREGSCNIRRIRVLQFRLTHYCTHCSSFLGLAMKLEKCPQPETTLDRGNAKTEPSCDSTLTKNKAALQQFDCQLSGHTNGWQLPARNLQGTSKHNPSHASFTHAVITCSSLVPKRLNAQCLRDTSINCDDGPRSHFRP